MKKGIFFLSMLVFTLSCQQTQSTKNKVAIGARKPSENFKERHVPLENQQFLNTQYKVDNDEKYTPDKSKVSSQDIKIMDEFTYAAKPAKKNDN